MKNKPLMTMKTWQALATFLGVFLLCTLIFYCTKPGVKNNDPLIFAALTDEDLKVNPLKKQGNPDLDTVLFNQKLQDLVHQKPTAEWPVKTAYPLGGASFPFNRVIAFYGNFFSKRMGILGELPADEMLKKLKGEVEKWEAADTLTTVVPAIHYIAVTAQYNSGKDGKYRYRMPAEQIEKAIELAKKINAIVFLDIQVGHSTLQEELPRLEKYLSLPNVHLGIDPEFSMKGGQVPCTVIGSFDAEDINYTSKWLSTIVKQYNLPPKILIVHRFTIGMVTNTENISTRPEVQLVMHMDGFGFPAKKISSYKTAIVNKPVEFTGIKLFYKQDQPRMMEPGEILKLYPKPVYIQYQ